MPDYMKSKSGELRRLIREQILIYDEEPSFKDVFVEGPFDARIINWFLKSHGRRHNVLPIDLIFVPTEEVKALGLDDGERDRLLTFGALLEKQLRNPQVSMPIIIVDLDRDALVSPLEPVCRTCLFTDFTSMEMYGYDTEVMEKLLSLGLHAKGITAQETLKLIEPVLIELFLIRAALHIAGTGISLRDNVVKYCKRNAESVEIKVRELLQHSISDYNIRPRQTPEQIMSIASELRTKLPDDARLAIRGHDFTQLLTWVLSPHIEKCFRNDAIITNGLIVALEKLALENHSLFFQLLQRTRSEEEAVAD